MENQLTNEEIARIYNLYELSDVNLVLKKESYWEDSYPEHSMGHGVKQPGFAFPFIRKQVERQMRYGIMSSSSSENTSGWEYIYTHCVLELIPLDEISSGHCEQCLRLFGYNTSELFGSYVFRNNRHYISYDTGNDFGEIWIERLPYPAHQYLILNKYAVPLFFGVDHWANGKTAIELGIAIGKI